MKKVAHLIDPNNYVIAIYELSMSDTSIDGTLRNVFSWELDGTPFESHFFAEASIKWDACSHFYFYGEDYNKGDKEKDSYYHVCGVDTYVRHMVTMAFAYKVMTDQLPDSQKYMTEYNKKMQDKLFGFLEGYTIVYPETEENLGGTNNETSTGGSE